MLFTLYQKDKIQIGVIQLRAFQLPTESFASKMPSIN